METTPTFGSWLRRERRAHDWTQEELATQAGCSPALIRKLEAGERRPSRQLAELLADQFGLEPTARDAFLQLAREEAPPVAPRATPEPAALRLAALPTLPVYLTPLIGRAADVQTLAERVYAPDVRLLTLTGAPGIGKTRLALAVAAAVVDAFPDGVTFVSFAPISDPALVATALAQALGLQETGGATPLDQLLAYLRDKRLLLVLDNFEQVVSAAPVVTELLAGSPAVKILVTSRQALRVRGERQWAVAPLAVPPADAAPDPVALAATPAVALFVDRAQAVNPTFDLTPDNAAAVATICTRLEGLPLAIEIAAARSKLLVPREIAARLDHRLKMLTGGPRDLPPRHQTLRNAIGWSYDLLPPPEQRLFARLGVFVGGAPLEAVEEVCNPDGDLGLDILPGLASLLDKSLLHQGPELAGAGQFAMLETVREFALERLEASGEADEVRRRHATTYLALAEAAARHLRGPQGRRHVVTLEAAHDNLRAGLGWSLGTPPYTPLGVRLVAALWLFWLFQGHLAEGRAWIERALAVPTSPELDARRANLLFGLGQLAWAQGDLRAARASQETSLPLWQAQGDVVGQARSRSVLGGVLLEQGDLIRARAVLEQSVALAPSTTDPGTRAWSLYYLGVIESREGDPAASRAHLDEMLALARAAATQRDRVLLLAALADAVSLQGDAAAAAAYAEEALGIAQALGDPREIGRARHTLAFAAYRQGANTRAAELFAENAALARRQGNLVQLAWTLNHLGNIARLQGDDAQAETYYREAQALFEERGDRHGQAATLHNRGYVAQHAGDWPQAEAHFSIALKLFQDLGYRWSVVDTIIGLAGVRLHEGYAALAARLLGAAEAQHAVIDPTNALLEPANRAEWERTVAALRAALDPAALEAAWTAGRILPRDQAIALALEPLLHP